jgi:hypothetical protein
VRVLVANSAGKNGGYKKSDERKLLTMIRHRKLLVCGRGLALAPACWGLWSICIGNGSSNSPGLCLALLGTGQRVFEELTYACGELAALAIGLKAHNHVARERYRDTFGVVEVSGSCGSACGSACGLSGHVACSSRTCWVR